ncbi:MULTISPECIES: trypsin-like peptidase domain-containing protein [Roseivirga]|jgi:Do/DeqQ family serine protease|uniref:Serine protease n=1 Tax=Roseivirga thermotolerans TaxID=1758176 RepID=A0ABQ3I3X4_9BACT|nr:MULTISPECIES: trypsin-like peptidase domain-containing protein [Roseivirga]MEC7753122.1 trypsin-like peptidase domain-containing protein [Bacteroidota bacterium]GHE51781.1 serine protease [Roseivirga thermotolerans]|tara:strand:- start:3197 stop:4660 length:1464 start_codon:yes stop_codon:yes gene_type:complete
MKTNFRIVLIAFLSGLGGAYLYQQVVQPTPVTEIIREVPTYQRANNFSNYNDESNAALPVDFRRAAEKSVHSVVYIKNLQRSRRSLSFLDYFYGREVPSNEVAIGSGSGVIYSEDGYIITNNHVIKGADEIEVQHEKRTYRATLVGTDPDMDIAVLKIEANNLPAINIAKSSTVKVGDWVLAVGNPFNLTSTVTAGIVSALGGEANALRENFPIEQYIQTDAAINPGNSGGALVDINGNLIGINTSIISRTGSYAGYGFAVPSDIVVKIVEDLKKYKVVQKAFTGAEVLDIDENLAKKAGIKNLNGVLVESIRRQGAADNAGLEPGDVIKRIDGKNISSKSSYDEVIGSRSPGDKITVQYERNGRLFETELVLENVYGNTEILGEEALDKDDIYFSNYLGAELRKLTPGEKQRMGLKIGVVVSKIDKERGFMRRLDLEEGDVILAINRRGAQDPEAVAKYIQNYYGRIYFEIIDKSGTQRTLTYRFQ